MTPIIFSSKKALSFLIDNGEVYTLRKRRRAGKAWLTARRGGRKIADVTVEEVGKVVFRENEPYVLTEKGEVHLSRFTPKSGFRSTDEWLRELRRLHGKTPEDLFLYRVVLK